MPNLIEDAQGTALSYLGPGLEMGPLPAFFYFALSAHDSLLLHPYSQPPQQLTHENLRVFSLTIPGHEEGLSPFHAMQYWADRMLAGENLLEDFFEKCANAIRWLIDVEIADSHRLAVGGLSRGGFVATHIAARVPQIQTVLGLAPLTDLMLLKEFSGNTELELPAQKLNLLQLIPNLSHIHHLRFLYRQP